MEFEIMRTWLSHRLRMIIFENFTAQCLSDDSIDSESIVSILAQGKGHIKVPQNILLGTWRGQRWTETDALSFFCGSGLAPAKIKPWRAFPQLCSHFTRRVWPQSVFCLFSQGWTSFSPYSMFLSYAKDNYYGCLRSPWDTPPRAQFYGVSVLFGWWAVKPTQYSPRARYPRQSSSSSFQGLKPCSLRCRPSISIFRVPVISSFPIALLRNLFYIYILW